MKWISYVTFILITPLPLVSRTGAYNRCPTITLSVWIKEWTNSPIVPRHGYIGYFCCLRKESKNRHRSVEETGDYNLKELPTISLEQRMWEKRNCKQELSVKGRIHSSQLYAVLVSMPSKRQKQAESEMILKHSSWALQLVPQNLFPSLCIHFPSCFDFKKRLISSQDICTLKWSQITQKSSRCPIMRLHGFCVRGRESESTAVFSQLPLHCVLTTTAQGRTVCCSGGGRRHPTPLWATEPWQWPLLVKVCCQKNTEGGQKAGWGGKGKTQPGQRSRNPTYLLKKASGLPKMHKWLTSPVVTAYVTWDTLILHNENLCYFRCS